MKVLIIEDEKHTSNRLLSLLKEIDDEILVLAVLDSVKKAKKWFVENEAPELIFQDISLKDGNGFDIYEDLKINVPIVFTTAFDQYAIKSFELNIIAYLVKPYDANDIQKALDKFHSLQIDDSKELNKVLKDVMIEKENSVKRRFLIRNNDKYNVVNSSEIAYFYSEESLSFASLYSGKTHLLDEPIGVIIKQLDNKMFFQINRATIINIDSIDKIHSYFNSRLKLQLKVPSTQELIVSRERVKVFKEWIEN
jgi:two-component system, LytTR family, response regulator LytT